MDSILTSIKKMLGINAEYTQFDVDIKIHINSVFAVLAQLGIGPVGGYSIQDESESWDAFLKEATNLELVKTYVYLKVRMLFDPPVTAALVDSANRMITEFEWRLLMCGEENGVDEV